jgi:hypothetical protein
LSGRPWVHDLFDHRVEGAALRTLNPEKVPLATRAFLFAIDAHDINQPLKLGRHRVLFDLPPTRIPGSSHAFLRNDRLLTQRTSVVETSKLSKTVRMDGVSTGQILGGLSRAEHVFNANWASVLVLVRNALVRSENGYADAHATLVAVPKRFDPSDSAQPTEGAMKWLLRHWHPEVTNAAMILPEDGLAVHALISGIHVKKWYVRRSEIYQTILGRTWTAEETGLVSWYVRRVLLRIAALANYFPN